VTYENPCWLRLVNAIDAVQASMQKMAPPTDLSGLTTVAAYETTRRETLTQGHSGAECPCAH